MYVSVYRNMSVYITHHQDETLYSITLLLDSKTPLITLNVSETKICLMNCCLC